MNGEEYIQYQPVIKKKVIAIDSIFPSSTLSSITDNLSSAAPVFTYPLDDDLFIPVWRKMETVNRIDAAIGNEIVIAKSSYHAIVGCFGDPKNASDLITELKTKGFNAYEVDVKGGLHRVSAGNTNKSSDISTLRKSIASTDLNVWILKK